MKRIHLFEFEDQKWFPHWLRECITKMIIPMHQLLGTTDHITEVLAPALKTTDSSQIIDLCSGSGGPMPEIFRNLQIEYNFTNLDLVLTDLYPQKNWEHHNKNDSIRYENKPVDATNLPKELNGFRTMICGFHHMKPDEAKKILISAFKDKAPLLVFEISDNSVPLFLAFLALPINFLMGFVVSLFVKPYTWQQFVFTYLIPFIPLTFAWDGAISNMRTYTLSDLDELLIGLQSEDYIWKKERVGSKAKMLYLLGLPK